MSTEPEALHRHALNGPTMGTRYSVVFYARPGSALQPLHEQLQQAVNEVDRQMSTWKPGSDICRFNNAAVEVWVDLPAEMLSVIRAAIEIGQASNGAFDIGVGDIVNAWGFGPSGRRPDGARIDAAEAAARPGFATLDLDWEGRRLRKRSPIAIDLSGIAKGFGVDQLAHVLERAGITDYLVSIDGEMRASGAKPGGMPWAVGVERPHRQTREVAGVVELKDCAIATSGDYRHWVSKDGRDYSHTIDPASGRPADSKVASVTVLADDCMSADAWATALMVLGEERGPVMATALGLDALFFIREQAGIAEIATGALRQPEPADLGPQSSGA